MRVPNRPRYSKAALTRTLQSCGALVAICVVMVGFMSARRTAAENRGMMGEQHIHDARARLDTANAHRDLLANYGSRYDQLIREGLTVRFDRAVAGDWFEAAIPRMIFGEIDGYVIGKNMPYAGPETAELSAFHVISHRLDFAATVADEDEFTGLMSSLGSRLPGTAAQEGCSLTRHRESRGGSVEPNGGAMLAARCVLIWYEFSAGNADVAANSGT
ncbi:MAG: hypothetical protein JWN43_3587 [Gammaproteobacteria bacterium]|nr:hypothetical protein [Gammaproteobacteria bacterium]